MTDGKMSENLSREQGQKKAFSIESNYSKVSRCNPRSKKPGWLCKGIEIEADAEFVRENQGSRAKSSMIL